MKATICPICNELVAIDEKGQGTAKQLCPLHELEVRVNAAIATEAEYTAYKNLLRERALERRYPKVDE